MYTACGVFTGWYVREMYRSFQRLYDNAVFGRVLQFLGMVYCNERCRNPAPNVQGATAPVSFCIQLVAQVRRRMSGCCIVPYIECTKTAFAQGRTPWPRNRTRTARGATGPSSLRIKLVAPVRRHISGCCIESYRECRKIPFAQDWTPWS